MASQRRLSGIQKQVLSLYRSFLRAARTKPPATRLKIQSYVTTQFRRGAVAVDKKDFQQIEYLLRRAAKQLDLLRSADITGFDVFNAK